MPRAVRLVLVLVCATVTLCACSSPGDPVPQAPTMTLDQARAAAEDYARGTTSVLPPGARLEPFTRSENLCTDTGDGRPPGRVQVTRVYFVRDLPPAVGPQVVDALARYFPSRGFRLRQDDRPARADVFYVNDRDGFNGAVQTSTAAEISVAAASPCVWPNGTGPPA